MQAGAHVKTGAKRDDDRGIVQFLQPAAAPRRSKFSTSDSSLGRRKPSGVRSTEGPVSGGLKASGYRAVDGWSVPAAGRFDLPGNVHRLGSRKPSGFRSATCGSPGASNHAGSQPAKRYSPIVRDSPALTGLPRTYRTCRCVLSSDRSTCSKKPTCHKRRPVHFA